jgi:hypothetical protein
MTQQSKPALYGHLEHEYACRFAEALLTDSEFRRFILGRTKFGGRGASRVLIDQMVVRRSKGAKFWWKNYFTESCRCFGCSGHETDVFAVIQDGAGECFAVHVEMKQPTDRFNPATRQGERYRMRAACWAGAAPPNVPPHTDACTIVVCSESKLEDFAQDLSWFDAVFTHEEIAEKFSFATAMKTSEAPYHSDFESGQRVFHGKFGYGTITAIEGNKLEIDFEHSGRKKVLDSFVNAD